MRHSYYYPGPRTAWPTTARLLAKALNCHKAEKPTVTPCRSDAVDVCPSCREIGEGRSLDVLEFDAASHTKVEEIRQIILEGLNIAPARDRFKMFIIDEVHMLSNSSFNALLKSVEEPPPNLVFVMATTELHKVPDTIASRCQEFQFRTISTSKIFDRLRLIADNEGVDIEDGALREVARSGEGSMRDAQSNLDQVISFASGRVSVEDVLSALGMAGTEILEKAIVAIGESDVLAVLNIVADLSARGQDLRNFCRDLMACIRDLSVYKVSQGSELVDSSAFSAETLSRLSEYFSMSDLVRIFHSLADTESRLKDAIQSRHTVELGLVKLVEMRRLASLDSILERLSVLGSSVAATPQMPQNETFVVSTASAPKEPTPSTPTPHAVDDAIETLEKKTLIDGDPTDRDNEENDETEFADADGIFENTLTPLDEDSSNFEFSIPDFVDLSFVKTTPLRFARLSSEDLEHFEVPKLDEAYETALEISGESLRPLYTAAELYRMIAMPKERVRR
ncbi:DNA polymerase III subunit gamma/tau [Leptolyngbya sp. 7M]|uniref:DNA polymerase III subunit gamma/tau n=1 Tax=Leptolyngbya sp. 7M TaxID=2812896 RepID=UPI001B8ACF3B|nr:DNA polymerase III subunit gamma/tau [Leptolyngbya sp. 7M]QYO68732.1 DNA polymerase III subunit gamma/tau [Leptolyngbya sp. 7M]